MSVGPSVTQTADLIKVLKRQLKLHGLNYSDVASALNLSEASVKRLFSQKNMSLDRLEAIATLAHVSFAELAQLANEEVKQLDMLTEQQENALAADSDLLLAAVCLINGYSAADISQHYNFTEHQLFSLLARLDKLGLIELLPANRIRLLLSPTFQWRGGGPIQHFFHRKIKQEYFQSSFTEDTDELLVVNGLLSLEGSLRLQQKMKALIKEFAKQAEKDKSLSMAQRYGSSMVVAIRRWQPTLFKSLERPKN